MRLAAQARVGNSVERGRPAPCLREQLAGCRRAETGLVVTQGPFRKSDCAAGRFEVPIRLLRALADDPRHKAFLRKLKLPS